MQKTDKPLGAPVDPSEARESASKPLAVHIRNSDTADAAAEAAMARFAPQCGWSIADEFHYRLLLRCLNYLDEATLAAQIEVVFALMERSRNEAALQSREGRKEDAEEPTG